MPIYKKVNKKFFKKWTRDIAYVVGFFAADGYMTLNKRGANFWNIQITDKSLLYKIRKIIKAEHKISEKLKDPAYKKIYRLQVGSKEMCNDLRNLGFLDNKTKNMAVPSIPSIYLPDFTRGYFDGDGNVWVGQVHKERSTKLLAIRTVFTSCYVVFLETLKNKLESFNIFRGVLSKGKGNYYRLTYSIYSSLKLYDFMYNRCNGSSKRLLLKRKRDVFEKYIRMRP